MSRPIDHSQDDRLPEPPDDRRDLGRRALRSLARPYWRHYAIAVVLLGVTSLAVQSVPYLLRVAVDALHGAGRLHPAVRAAGLMLVAALVGALTRVVSRLLVFHASRCIERDVRDRLFSRLLSQEPAYFHQMPVGEIMSRLTNDLTTVRLIFGPGIVALANAVMVYGIALTLMASVDPRLTLYAALPLPVLIGLSALLMPRLYRRSLAVQRQLGDLGRALQEDLGAVDLIKGFGLEAQRWERLGDRSALHRDSTIALARLRGALWGLLGFLGGAAVLIVLWLGALAVTEGRLTLGELVQFNGHLALILWPTLFLGWALSLLQRGRAAWSRLQELLSREPAITEPAGAAPLPRDGVRGHLEVRGLTLERGGQQVLQDVTFEVTPGEAVALVGATGAGKTSVVEALPRLCVVPAGAVFLDGRDVTTLPLSDLRRAFGYAPQDAWLLSDTLRENIAWGLSPTERAALTAEAEEARLREAVAQAGLESDLTALPEGLDTVVGERGVLLSGGQRQRACLARALVGDAPVLLLDDCLSAVDVRVERRILQALRDELRDRTLLLITHRPTALAGMDRVVVLEKGRVVEQGTHEGLIAAGGRYAALYEEQRRKDRWDPVESPAGEEP